MSLLTRAIKTEDEMKMKAENGQSFIGIGRVRWNFVWFSSAIFNRRNQFDT